MNTLHELPRLPQLPTLEELNAQCPEEPLALEPQLKQVAPHTVAAPGWNDKDVVVPHPRQPKKEAEQLAASSVVEAEQSRSWFQRMGDWLRSFVSGSEKRIDAVDRPRSRSTVQLSSNDLNKTDEVQAPQAQELSDVKKRDLRRMHDKFTAFMDRMQKDFPGMSLDQIMEQLFYAEQESKETEFEAQKINLQRAYTVLQEHRQEYQKLTEDLLKEMKSASWFRFGEEFASTVTACAAATTLGPGWVLPALCFAVGKMANSMNGNVLEHATARLAACTGIVTEEKAYLVIQTGFSAILLAGSFALSGNITQGMSDKLKTVVGTFQVGVAAGRSKTEYTTENRKADQELVASHMQLEQKSVDKAMQDVTAGRKRYDHNAQIIANWASQLNAQIRMMMS